MSGNFGMMIFFTAKAVRVGYFSDPYFDKKYHNVLEYENSEPN